MFWSLWSHHTHHCFLWGFLGWLCFHVCFVSIIKKILKTKRVERKVCGYHNKKDVKFMLKFYQKSPKHTLISILGVKKPVNTVNNQILHLNFQSRHKYYTTLVFPVQTLLTKENKQTWIRQSKLTNPLVNKTCRINSSVNSRSSLISIWNRSEYE